MGLDMYLEMKLPLYGESTKQQREAIKKYSRPAKPPIGGKPTLFTKRSRNHEKPCAIN